MKCLDPQAWSLEEVLARVKLEALKSYSVKVHS